MLQGSLLIKRLSCSAGSAASTGAARTKECAMRVWRASAGRASAWRKRRREAGAWSGLGEVWHGSCSKATGSLMTNVKRLLDDFASAGTDWTMVTQHVRAQVLRSSIVVLRTYQICHRKGEFRCKYMGGHLGPSNFQIPREQWQVNQENHTNQ